MLLSFESHVTRQVEPAAGGVLQRCMHGAPPLSKSCRTGTFTTSSLCKLLCVVNNTAAHFEIGFTINTEYALGCSSTPQERAAPLQGAWMQNAIHGVTLSTDTVASARLLRSVRHRMVHSSTWWLAVILTATVALSATSAAPLPESFSEELLLQPVPGNLVAVSEKSSLSITSAAGRAAYDTKPRLMASAVLQAHLHFQVEGALGSSHVLFPRVVDQLAAVTNVSEFHLALTQGRWVSHCPIWPSVPPAYTQCSTCPVHPLPASCATLSHSTPAAGVVRRCRRHLLAHSFVHNSGGGCAGR